MFPQFLRPLKIIADIFPGGGFGRRRKPDYFN